MEIILIILLCVGGFILLSIIGGYIFYYTYAVHHGKPLSPEELEICKKILRERKAYPFVCKLSIKYGKCPCLPCDKLNKAKNMGK